MNADQRLRRVSRRQWVTWFFYTLFALSLIAYIWSEKQIDKANELRLTSYLLADELRQSSDDLTRMARTYVVTGEPAYKANYQDILDIRNGRKPRPEAYQNIYWDLVLSNGSHPRPSSGQAVPLLELMRRAGFSEVEFHDLEAAEFHSDALAALECEAMRLAEATGPEAVAQRAKARQMLFGVEYHHAKAAIMKPIAEFYGSMDRRTLAAVRTAEYWAYVLKCLVIVIGLSQAQSFWRTSKVWRETLQGLEREYQRVTLALQESQASHRDVIASLPAGAYQMRVKTHLNWHTHGDSNHAFEFMSARFCELLGLGHDELMADPGLLLKLLHPDDRHSFLHANEMARPSQQPFVWEGRMVVKNQTHWMHFASKPRPISPDETLWTGVLLDVTDRKTAEEGLRQSERRYRLLAENTRDVIWVLDASVMRFLYVSPSVEQLLGYTPEEMLELPFSEILLPENQGAFFRLTRQRVEAFSTKVTANVSYRNEVVHVRKDGAMVDTEVVNNYYYNVEACRVEIQGISRDITERRKAEQALRESEARYRTLVDHAPWGILAVQAGRFVFCNHAGASLAGCQSHELIGMSALDIVHPDSREAILDRIKNLQSGNENPLLTMKVMKKDGSIIDTESISVPIALNGQPAALILCQEITERKQMGEVLTFLAQSVGHGLGQDFFESLANFLAMKLHADFVCIDRLEGDGLNAKTLAVWNDGKFEDNVAYALKDTPCGEVVGKAVCCFPASVCQLFPRDDALRNLQAESYLGVTLWDHAGTPIGLIALISRQALANLTWAESVLQIVAVRAGAELERLQAEQALLDSEKLYHNLFDNMLNGLAYCRMMFEQGQPRDFIYLNVNNMFETLTGLRQVVGKKVSEVIPGIRESDPELFELYGRVSLSGVSERVEMYVKALQMWLSLAVFCPVPGHFVAIFEDITLRKQAENEIEQLAFYDPLTGLPNRRLLLDRLRQALVASARSESTGALLFIDLDNFKALNDSFGHDQGDLLLQQVAQRLVVCVRGSDTVARMGGDEFVVMLEDLNEKPHEAAVQAENVGGKILSALNKPYPLGGREHHSSTSIGATLFKGQQLSVAELLKQADLAMYQAKAAGRNTQRFFNPDMQLALEVRSMLEHDLREGLGKGQFLLYYQAQVDCTGCLKGVEALVRWQHPRHGLMSPGGFIALAEDTGLILPLGNWVLETACRQLAEWANRPETAELTMAVNVSARQFCRPDFVEQVAAVLAQTGAYPCRLKLELTESLLFDTVEDTIAKMAELKARGVAFALDDFGIGYSSLSYLKRLPLDQLKIDGSFVRDVLTEPNDAAIIRTIVALGQTFGLAVIAEGVETEAQRDCLAELGCQAFQGYFFGRPLPVEALQLN
jgi:diguanylate cyclase (GGDEF)-like protein/PAS domain S-box-containing protein